MYWIESLTKIIDACCDINNDINQKYFKFNRNNLLNLLLKMYYLDLTSEKYEGAEISLTLDGANVTNQMYMSLNIQTLDNSHVFGTCI